MKSPKVSIYSLKELYQQDYADAGAIISVSGPNSVQKDKLNGLHYLLLEYRDVDYPDVLGSFSDAQATAVAVLTRDLPQSVERIFCVCEAGISRKTYKNDAGTELMILIYP